MHNSLGVNLLEEGVMPNTVVNIDHVTCAGTEKARREVKKNGHLVKRIIRMISVDTDCFYESEDWPYLWSGRHIGSRK